MQGNVAEACGRKCRDGEIERINVVGDGRIAPVLGLVDHSRHDEKKNGEIHYCNYRFLILTEKGAVEPKPCHELVHVEQS